MKNKLIMICAALIFFAKIAEAIVIVPPVIYIATFSIGTFVLNAFIMTSAYMAGRGLIDRFYFGKHLHELVGIAFSYVGSIVLIMSSSFVAISFFDPIDARSLFYASVFSSFLSFLVMGLNNFRKYLLADSYGKNEAILRLIALSSVVFIITFISGYFSISTRILKKSEPYGLTLEKNARNSPINLNFGIDFSAKEKSADSLEEKPAPAPLPVSEKTIWFNPYIEEKCEIYAGDKFVKSEAPSGKCFYFDGNNVARRIICPVSLDIEEVRDATIGMNGVTRIEGRGSCLDNYKVYVSDKGFKIIQ